MKKKILFIIPLLLLTLCLISCKSCKKDDDGNIDNDKNKYTTFELLVRSIYDSETKHTGYSELTQMFDEELEIYNKDSKLTLKRGTPVESEIYILEKTLSSSGDKKYEENITSYKTVGDKKYVIEDGITYESEYKEPSYYLTFVLSEEFLEKGYTLENNNDDYILKAKVLSNKASSLFLNKSVGLISDLEIEIIVKDNKLQTFKANYTSKNGFKVQIETKYNY